MRTLMAAAIAAAVLGCPGKERGEADRKPAAGAARAAAADSAHQRGDSIPTTGDSMMARDTAQAR